MPFLYRKGLFFVSSNLLSQWQLRQRSTPSWKVWTGRYEKNIVSCHTRPYHNRSSRESLCMSKKRENHVPFTSAWGCINIDGDPCTNTTLNQYIVAVGTSDRISLGEGNCLRRYDVWKGRYLDRKIEGCEREKIVRFFQRTLAVNSSDVDPVEESKSRRARTICGSFRGLSGSAGKMVKSRNLGLMPYWLMEQLRFTKMVISCIKGQTKKFMSSNLADIRRQG